MAGLFDFNCPQFVDFTEDDKVEMCSSLDETYVNKDLTPPEFIASIKKNYDSAMKDVRMTSTPYANTIKNRKVKDRPCSKNLKKRRSKSLDDLQPVKVNDNVKTSTKRHSVSHCLPKFRIKTRPTTPLCLKRVKTKKLKTTEELELEKIAEMQEETRKHLRYNAWVVGRYLKPKPAVVSTLPHRNGKQTKHIQTIAASSNALRENVVAENGCTQPKVKKIASTPDFLFDVNMKQLRTRLTSVTAFNFKMPEECKNDQKVQKHAPFKLQPSHSTKEPAQNEVNRNSKPLHFCQMNYQRKILKSDSSFAKPVGKYLTTSKPRSVSSYQDTNKENVAALEKGCAAITIGPAAVQKTSKPRSVTVSQKFNKENVRAIIERAERVVKKR